MAHQRRKTLKRLRAKNGKRKATRVLYVEDARVIHDAISMLLELNGYQVAYARNGQEGIEMALRWQPDVVLMDLCMPVMDGYTAINKIKLNPKTRQIPVFVMSAWSGQKEYTQAKLAGADEYFVKPPDLNKLIGAIEKAIANSQGNPPPPARQ